MKEQKYPYLNGKTGNHPHIFLKANDRSYFSLLKKEIHALAIEAGFKDKKIAEIDIIVAEMASNLVKHAGGGDLLVKILTDPKRPGLEIISLDNGPGMADANRMMTDGLSTQQTLGIGLGTINRLADVFQVYSMKGWGTILLVRVFLQPDKQEQTQTAAEIRSIVFAKPGEQYCGDRFFHKVSREYIQLFLGDGLGHGEGAADAVEQAGACFFQEFQSDPVQIIRSMNLSVKKTRGLVGTAAVFDRKSKSWQLCGVGNISTKASSPIAARQHLSYNGIIGLNVPRTLNAQPILHDRGQLIIMCSDGIRTRWDHLKYTGIYRYDLSVLAAAIVKDFGRFTDDTSVAICKINA